MMKPVLAAAFAALVLSASDAAAQVAITPMAGAFIPASDLRELRDEADARRLERESTLGLGLGVDVGWFRGTVAYASGATITGEGVENRDELGDGSVLAASAALVVRPIPRVLVQPYLLGGVGLKRQDFSFDDDGVDTNPLPRDRTDLALHVGVGADLMLGAVGLVAEVSDFISRRPGDGNGSQHDAFVFVGLRIVFGGD